MSKLPLEDEPQHTLERYIEPRIPLVWILSVTGALAWFLISNHFGQQKIADSQVSLREEISELKIIVKSGNTASTTLGGELTLLRFRVEALENGQILRPQGRP